MAMLHHLSHNVTFDKTTVTIKVNAIASDSITIPYIKITSSINREVMIAEIALQSSSSHRLMLPTPRFIQVTFKIDEFKKIAIMFEGIKLSETVFNFQHTVSRRINAVITQPVEAPPVNSSATHAPRFFSSTARALPDHKNPSGPVL